MAIIFIVGAILLGLVVALVHVFDLHRPPELLVGRFVRVRVRNTISYDAVITGISGDIIFVEKLDKNRQRDPTAPRVAVLRESVRPL